MNYYEKLAEIIEHEIKKDYQEKGKNFSFKAKKYGYIEEAATNSQIGRAVTSQLVPKGIVRVWQIKQKPNHHSTYITTF